MPCSDNPLSEYLPSPDESPPGGALREELSKPGATDQAQAAKQLALIRCTEFIPTVGGRPHRRRARALPGNRRKPGRPKHGKGVQELRRYLVGMSKRNGGRAPWIELDLNRVFNALGYSLSWGRELFRRLTLDPFFRNLCKVRFIQKRLIPPDRNPNGCFVILIAFKAWLQFDQEPLFYGRDDQTRHLREKLRGADMPEPVGYVSRDCPVSGGTHTKVSSTYRTAVANNNGASAEKQSSGFAEMKVRDLAYPTPQWDRISHLRTSLKNDFSGALRLRKKKIWMTFELQNLHWPGCKVDFKFDQAYRFASEALTNGHVDKSIAATWQKAIHETITNISDSAGGRYSPKVGEPIALCLWHARRILADLDGLGRRARIENFYRRRMFADHRRTKRLSIEARQKTENKAKASALFDPGACEKTTMAEKFRALRAVLADGTLAKALENKEQPED